MVITTRNVLKKKHLYNVFEERKKNFFLANHKFVEYILLYWVRDKIFCSNNEFTRPLF